MTHDNIPEDDDVGGNFAVSEKTLAQEARVVMSAAEKLFVKQDAMLVAVMQPLSRSERSCRSVAISMRPTTTPLPIGSRTTGSIKARFSAATVVGSNGLRP